MLTFSAEGISVAVDLAVGHIADFSVKAGDRTLRPLHRAPWIGEPDLPTDIAAGLARLSGDFLCAPFSRSDIEEAPGHGWPANSPWSVTGSGRTPDGWRAELRLDRTVMGAVVEKTLTLRDGHPFLYQEHRFLGGSGDLPASHHVMGIMADGGKLAFSPKRFGETPEQPLEPDPSRGRYMLAYPAHAADITRFPLAAGGVTDLSVYRPDDRREDFVVLVEAEHAGPGWTALARRKERDMLLVLKRTSDLPVTMLWFSNGGRDYTPWNGRHLGVLGIEDGRTAVGHAASVGDNFLKRAGVPTVFRLVPDGAVSFRHVIGALPNSDGETPVALETESDALRLQLEGGETKRVPFDTTFLDGEA